MPKLVGHIGDTPIYEDPNVPAGKMYFFDDFSGDFQVDNRNRKQRIIDFFKKCYYKVMKQQLFILAASVVVLVCTGVAIVTYTNHKANADVTQASAVTSLKKQLKDSQAKLNLHDSVNATAIKNAGDQIILLNQQKATICTQVKAARLSQPLCP